MESASHQPSVAGSLAYLVPQAEKPYQYMYTPRPGIVRANCRYEQRTCDIVDARALPTHNRGTALAARAARAMTSGAQRVETSLARLAALAVEPRSSQDSQDENANGGFHAIIL